MWDKVFKNGLSKFCGRQPLKIWRDIRSALSHVWRDRPRNFKFWNWVKSFQIRSFFWSVFSCIRKLKSFLVHSVNSVKQWVTIISVRRSRKEFYRCIRLRFTISLNSIHGSLFVTYLRWRYQHVLTYVRCEHISKGFCRTISETFCKYFCFLKYSSRRNCLSLFKFSKKLVRFKELESRYEAKRKARNCFNFFNKFFEKKRRKLQAKKHPYKKIWVKSRLKNAADSSTYNNSCICSFCAWKV